MKKVTYFVFIEKGFDDEESGEVTQWATQQGPQLLFFTQKCFILWIPSS